MRSSLGMLLACMTATVLTAAPAQADPKPAPWVEDRKISDERIAESSGLYASQLHPGTLWTHNDGKGKPTLYAIGKDGRTQATITLDGVEAVDTEAMSGFVDMRGNAVLYLADIGDNGRNRAAGVTLLEVQEPAELKSASLPAKAFQLVYPDGPQDAEALLVHPDSGNVYIVTKSEKGGAIYAVPAARMEGVANRMEYLSPVPHVISDGVINAKGHVFLRGYNKIRIFSDVAGELMETIAAPNQPQGESLTISPDGKSLIAGSEGKASTIFRLPVPAALAAAPPRKPGPQPEELPVAAAGSKESPFPMTWVMAGGIGLLLAIAVGFLIGRKRTTSGRGIVAADLGPHNEQA